MFSPRIEVVLAWKDHGDDQRRRSNEEERHSPGFHPKLNASKVKGENAFLTLSLVFPTSRDVYALPGSCRGNASCCTRQTRPHLETMDPIPPESDALERNRNESDFERHAEGTTIPLDNLEYPPPRIPPVSITSPESLLHNFSTHSLLVFATIWGVLARLGLEYLGSFSEGNVFKLIWPQIVGCLIMGFVVERKGSFEARSVFNPPAIGFE